MLPVEEETSSRRRLIGYYDSAQDAHDASMYMLEQATGTGVSGGNKLPSARFVEQKPPPTASA